jgi:SAM-dependent methyltransferase
VFVDACDENGRSSYQRLASLAVDATAVLDVACGTGTLLSLVHEVAPAVRLVGIDLSDTELQAAADRLPASHLCVARAQSLPLAAGSFDVVLCHLALMLMDRPEDALREVRRVLRPGGRFSAITNRSATPDALTKRILAALRPAWNRTGPGMRPPPIGDSRTLQADDLGLLLSATFEGVVVEQFAVVQHVPRDELWPYLVQSVYGFDAIPDAEARALLDELGLPDFVPWTLPLMQVQGRA